MITLFPIYTYSRKDIVHPILISMSIYTFEYSLDTSVKTLIQIHISRHTHWKTSCCNNNTRRAMPPRPSLILHTHTMHCNHQHVGGSINGGYPKIDRFWYGKSYWNGWEMGVPMSGNLHVHLVMVDEVQWILAAKLTTILDGSHFFRASGTANTFEPAVDTNPDHFGPQVQNKFLLKSQKAVASSLLRL